MQEKGIRGWKEEMQHGRAVCYAVIVTAMWKEF
jgi:hypothetical protein